MSYGAAHFEKMVLLTPAQHSKPTNKRKPSAAARPSEVEKGGSGVFPDYGNPTRTHAEEGPAERSGQAECNRKGIFGSLPVTAIQLARASKKAKPSAAARIGAMGKGG